MENFPSLANAIFLDENLEKVNLFGSSKSISTDPRQNEELLSLLCKIEPTLAGLKMSDHKETSVNFIPKFDDHSSTIDLFNDDFLLSSSEDEDNEKDKPKLTCSTQLRKINISALTVTRSLPKYSVLNNHQDIQSEPITHTVDLLNDDLFLSSSDDEDDKVNTQALFGKNTIPRKNRPTGPKSLLANKNDQQSGPDRKKLAVSLPNTNRSMATSRKEVPVPGKQENAASAQSEQRNFRPTSTTGLVNSTVDLLNDDLLLSSSDEEEGLDKTKRNISQQNQTLSRPQPQLRSEPWPKPPTLAPKISDNLRIPSSFTDPRQRCERKSSASICSAQSRLEDIHKIGTDFNRKAHSHKSGFIEKIEGQNSTIRNPPISRNQKNEYDERFIPLSMRALGNKMEDNQIPLKIKGISQQRNNLQEKKLLNPKNQFGTPTGGENLRPVNMPTTTNKLSKGIADYASSCYRNINQKVHPPRTEINFINKCAPPNTTLKLLSDDLASNIKETKKQPRDHVQSGEDNHQHSTQSNVPSLPKEVLPAKKVCPVCWFYLINCDCLVTLLHKVSPTKKNFTPAIGNPVMVNHRTSKISPAETKSSSSLLDQIMDKMGSVPLPRTGVTKTQLPKEADKRNKPVAPSNRPVLKNTRLEPPTIKPNPLSKLGTKKSTRDLPTDNSSTLRDEDQEKENLGPVKRKATPLENNMKRKKNSKKPETNSQKFRRVMRTMGIKRPKFVSI